MIHTIATPAVLRATSVVGLSLPVALETQPGPGVPAVAASSGPTVCEELD